MVIFQKKKALEHNAPRLWRRQRDSNPRGLSDPNCFQDWIVPLPRVHGSSLCIPNFTAKKDKKELKWTVFGKNARKLCEKGKNPKKI